MSTIKTVVAVAVKKHWPLFQLDVNNSFLHGDLDEEASRQWYAKLSQALSSRDYHHSLNDYSLFTRVYRDSIVVFAVYADDIILTGTDSAEISSLKSFLDAQFKIKDLGSLSYFLGIEVLYSDYGVLLHQKKFFHDLLLAFHCSDVAFVVCPLPLNVKLKDKEGTPLPKLFTVIGLPALTPGGLSLVFVYCWEVVWKSKKQSVVSMSSAEAEYRAMSKAAGELTWLHRLLLDPSYHSHCKESCFPSKHIELDCHLVPAKLTEGLIHLLHTSSSTQLVDIFTKALAGAAHHGLVSDSCSFDLFMTGSSLRVTSQVDRAQPCSVHGFGSIIELLPHVEPATFRRSTVD
uniref:Reverse transcriptase Ty1/copia-type domain-containing protein n=1 Tax=Nicotiana tabacum TaxID=4097 RepID=A0A1S3XG96_TOBAC|nr:PREDICTED: uncharacterized protein LOC107764854 [Nicotiana tabacum]